MKPLAQNLEGYNLVRRNTNQVGSREIQEEKKNKEKSANYFGN